MTPLGRSLRTVDFWAVSLLRRAGGTWFAVLSALAVLALVLGCWGFSLVPRAVGVSSGTDVFYQSLQMFVLEMPALEGETPLPLDVARLIAAFVSFSAVIGLLGTVFDQQLQAIRLWILGRDHVVVCGLGEKGGELVEALRRERRFVAVIESNPEHPDIPRCRAMGAVVLIGSSAEAWLLKKARVPDADVLLAMFRPDDRVNIEAAVSAYELCQEPRAGCLTCVLQVSDPDLAAVVRKHEISTRTTDWFELQTFNIDNACAQAMLREALVGLGGARTDHILVVGLDPPGRLAERLIVRAAKDWHIEYPSGTPKLTIDLLDRDASATSAGLLARHPFLDRNTAISTRDVAPDSADFLAGDAWLDRDHLPAAAFVCLEDEAKALVAADRLRAALPASVPIILRTIERNDGLGALVRGRSAERIIAVGMKDRAFQLAASLRPVQELLAQAVHQEYLKLRQRTEPAPGDDRASARLWEELDEDYRESSRAQARDFDRKLGLIGRSAVHEPDGPIVIEPMSEEEVERLARDEHERWCRERASQGWTHGEPREYARKRHPNLVPWDDPRLDEPTKDKDRNAVRRLPEILASADYRVVRDEPTPPAASAPTIQA